jgi:lysophospholipase L1-like esterase
MSGMRARRAFVVLVSLCATLGLAELGLRALAMPSSDACSTIAEWAVPDPQLGYRGAPGTRVAGFPLNEIGLRGPSPGVPGAPERTRILFLGDSTAFGLGVELEQTFAARSTALLAESAGAPVDYVIAAFPGYSSYHSAILLERLLPLGPDLVVLYVGARNDESRARWFPDAQIPARRARLAAAWHRVRLLRVLEGAADAAYRGWLRPLRGDAERARVPPDAFRQNLLRIADMLAEADVPGLVVLPPLSSVFEREHPLVRSYRELLVEVARERGLAVVSLDARFAAGAEQALFFSDHFHLSGAGHAIAAEEIHAAVRDGGLLGGRMRAP